MNLSVEVEPPKGVFQTLDQRESKIHQEIRDYAILDEISMISITNRPVFGLSPLTLASQIHKMATKTSKALVRVNLHLTTRLSHFDTFKYVLDAQRIGLSDILPILGDPRGPLDPNYFKNGFDLLGFVSFLKSGNTDSLSEKYRNMVERNELSGPIKDASFNIGTVVDVNKIKHMRNGKTIDIREKEIRFARRKEQLGAEYLISQAAFDAKDYFSFVDEADLNIPILAGVMPARLKLLNAFGIPISDLQKQSLRAQMTTDEEKKLGNTYATQIYRELLDGGCDDIHIYTIGNSSNFTAITGIEFEQYTKISHSESSDYKEKIGT